MALTIMRVEDNRSENTTDDPIQRHGRTGAPLIWSPETDPAAVQAWLDSGKKQHKKPKTGTYYTRTTTFVDAIDDKTNIALYKSRLTLVGAARDQSLVTEAAKYDDIEDADQKKALNKLVERAQQKADIDFKADQGTAVHKMTEDNDLKGNPGFVPPMYEGVIEAYRRVMEGYKVVSVEDFVVIDEYCVGGTFDRLILTPDGRLQIWDVKTGRIDYGLPKMGRQLAGYSRGKRYNPHTFQREPLTWNGIEVDQKTGVIIHLPINPKERGKAELIEVDLEGAWAEWEICRQIRESRKRKEEGRSIRLVQV